ncbi:MAG: exopolysaccharide biosynthesis polyprenyl glycosylphosphotransferase [Candidatus Eisenbacteria sp.]|nr:exopolysaccharide biosynthesis polyprenyl glycosylphosphotransferase [Candidatus Eisenbacteria bacterium]
MTVLGTQPQVTESDAGNVWPHDREDARAHKRISGRRAVGLALPGLFMLDAGLVAGSFWAALQILPVNGGMLASPARQMGPQLLALFAVLVVSFLIMGGMFGLYSRRSLFAPRRAMAAAARALFWSGTVAVAFAFLLALDPPGDFRWLLFKHAFVLAIAVMAVRPLVCRRLLRLAEVGPVSPQRVLIVGYDAAARRLAAALEANDPEGVVVAGLAGVAVGSSGVPSCSGERRRWASFPLRDWEEAGPLADALAVEEVLIATPEIGRVQAVELGGELHQMGIAVQVVPHLTRMFVEGTPINRDRGIPLARLDRRSPRAWERRLKRGLDVGLTLLGGMMLLPLLVLIAFAVKLTSPGPVLYAQRRVGRNGRQFRMFKFRSMSTCNDDTHYRRYITTLVREGNAAGRDALGRPVYKLVDDPRVTPIGRLMRATSLDELPQLINVLRGEMSLIGPRPCLPFEYELYDDWQRERLGATPGMTGLWQVSGRNLLSFEEMVLLDLYYVANWGFLLDLKILWRTIPEVLYGAGAR